MNAAARERGVDRAIRETDLPDDEIANEYGCTREYVCRRRALKSHTERLTRIVESAERRRAR